jgi:hypothetical protein
LAFIVNDLVFRGVEDQLKIDRVNDRLSNAKKIEYKPTAAIAPYSISITRDPRASRIGENGAKADTVQAASIRMSASHRRNFSPIGKLWRQTLEPSVLR